MVRVTPSCVIMVKLLNLSDPQVSPPVNKGNSIYPQELEHGLMQTMVGKSLLRAGQGAEEHSREVPHLDIPQVGTFIVHLVCKEIIVQRG